METSVRPAPRLEDPAHEASLDASIRELENAVKEQEQALNELRLREANPRPGDAKASLEILKRAYDDVAKSEPFFPHRESVLPALLAMRKTHQIIAESRSYLESQRTTLEMATKRLDVEQANLADQKALQRELEKRLESLRNGAEAKKDMTPEQIAQDKLSELKQKKRDFDKDTSKLLKSLNQFIDDHVAAMLAAEELGGPVVGDMMEIDTDDLAAGFSAQGKLKKTKGDPDQDKRQRRIDDIWGSNEPDQRASSKGPRNEAAAAGKELRGLLEELLNSLMASEGDASAAYVRIPRDSAASRFLVRSHVAQFHPKDATRLRLIDFGRDLDD
ncbi:uncharacterized protein E0L32_003655 [Thyridium curvatum]|uniref:Uncharacterized protein n=1 Tax=Thyridium curvatum TaxID=1093900 RepID=A0A507BDF4_9PEZI|nr:uncharacterized protein E0L32_003655 [Thyridium curvatum]TPX16714.1 hypothetical protein E0L32_003655 [Thyridium curvatum]